MKGLPPIILPFVRATLTLSACSLLLGCSDAEPQPKSGGGAAGSAGATAGTAASGGGGAGASGGASGSSGDYATQIPIAGDMQETADGALAGDARFAVEFCGDVDPPARLKPMGTVVRVKVSQRYFMCIGDLGTDSADLIQTNILSDPVQGFVPYAALFTYEDPARPNVERPANGPLNYGLLVINLLNDTPDSSANSACSGSNAVFDGLRVGGATAGLCSDVPSALRVDGGRKFVDVDFPDGHSQSFELEPIPFVPPTERN